MKKLRKSLAVFLTLGMLAGTLPAPVLAEETVPEYPSSEVEGFNETGENQTETEGSGFSSEEKKNENQETSGQEENPDQISDPVNENKADQGSELNNESEEKKNESEEQLKEESEKKQGESEEKKEDSEEKQDNSEEKKDSSEEKQENSQEQLKEDSEEKKEETDPKKSEELKAEIPSATYEESISISLGDNNVLLQGYMDMLSGLKQPAPNTRKKLRAATAAGYASLTSEHERRAYILISDYIRGIVSGENTSTIIEIEILSQFFDGKMEFTKEELGVDSILDSKGEIADEVDPAIFKLLFDVDYDKVFNALRADDPYRFFWMASGINLYKTFMRSEYDADSNQIIFYGEATVTLKMVVDWSYRGENEFVTNLYRITAASTTVENAKNVVAAAASMSDYDKLLYYNDWLCENVSYNHVAADEGYEQYGENNPWEIIYVFDNDPTTKVVCEGYAKSFKYLADLTSFSNSNIEVYTVEGSMNGGGHMWNVVQMDDGKKYMVDVTNSDVDQGELHLATHQLFLRGYNSIPEGCSSSGDGYIVDWGTYTLPGGGTLSDDPITYIYDADTKSTYSANPAILAIEGKNYTDPVPHVHEWTYSASGAVLTATCRNTDGGHTGDLTSTLTVVKPARTVYGGTESAEASVEGAIDGVDTPAIVYKKGTEVQSSAPTDAGTYTANITLNGETASVEYTIAKAALNPSVSLQGWAYGDAANSPQVTGNSGSGAVTFSYSDTESGTYSATVPTAAGDHYVKAAIAESANYQGAETAPAVFTISVRQVTVSGITAGNKEYDGTANAALNTTGAVFNGKLEGDTLTVSGTGTFANGNAGTGKTVTISNLQLGGKDAGNYVLAASGQQSSATANITPKTIELSWGETSFTYNGKEQKPTAGATGLLEGDTCTVSVTGGETNAGSYTATADSLSNTNYKLPTEKTKAFTIRKAALSSAMFNVNVPVEAVYDGKARTASVSIASAYAGKGVGTPSVAYYDEDGKLLKEAPKDAGSYTVKINVTEGTNYLAAENLTAEGWKFRITKATPVLSNEPKDATLAYTGKEIKLISAISTTGGTVMYSLNGSEWQDEVPTGKAAGAYKVHYKVDGGTNYKDLPEKTVTIRIKESQDKPVDLAATKASDKSAADAEITGVNEKMEYSIDNGKTYQSVTGTKITGLKAGDVLVRYKETETQSASEPAKVTIKTKESQKAPEGLIAINASTEYSEDAEIRGVNEQMEYSLDGKDYIPVSGNVIKGLGAGTVYVRYKATADKAASPAVKITIRAGRKSYSPKDGDYYRIWYKGSSSDLTISFKSSYDDEDTYDLFEGIWIDDEFVEQTDSTYTARKGSVAITLKSAYLEKLSTGRHTITAVFEDGESSARFYVYEKKNPDQDKEKSDSNKGTSENKTTTSTTGKTNTASNTGTSRIPATYDRGFFRDAASLVTSTVTAIIAAIVLRLNKE